MRGDRTKIVCVRFTPDEYALVSNAAEVKDRGWGKPGVALSEIVRLGAMDYALKIQRDYAEHASKAKAKR